MRQPLKSRGRGSPSALPRRYTRNGRRQLAGTRRCDDLERDRREPLDSALRVELVALEISDVGFEAHGSETATVNFSKNEPGGWMTRWRTRSRISPAAHGNFKHLHLHQR
jgi:hypothetical protein